MKTTGLLITLMIIVLQFSACKDDAIKSTDVSNTLKEGEWIITYFWDSDHEETENFAGYSFLFSITSTVGPSSGIVEVSNGVTDLVGSWATGYIDDAAKLTLNFTISPFDELNEDWRVTTRTSEKIELKHESGGGGGTDFLTFEKK